MVASLHPVLHNDLTIRAKIEDVSPLPSSPSPQQVASLLLEFQHLFCLLSEHSMSEHERVIALIKKIPKQLWKTIRTLPADRKQCDKFDSLAELLQEKCLEDWNENLVDIIVMGKWNEAKVMWQQNKVEKNKE